MEKVIVTPEEKAIADAIFEAAKEVLEQLGPGLLESVYEMCLEHELKLRGFSVERQVPLSVKYGQSLPHRPMGKQKGCHRAESRIRNERCV